jgi:hypothetical protein
MCAGGGLDCGNGVCVDPEFDPKNCGKCGNGCDIGRACDQGSCQCRPPTVQTNTGCSDLKHDPRNCGTVGNACMSNQLCGSSASVTGCISMLACALGTVCNGGCYGLGDFMSDANNCGSCGNACKSSEVCVAGACTSFSVPPVPVSTCSSSTCPSGSACCTYTGIPNDVICVTGSVCPP